MAESGLDLRAIGMEADLTRTMPEEASYGGPWQDAALRHADSIDRLIVHCRALRAALEEIEARAFIREDQYHTHESWRELMQWIGQRAAAVLRGAQDQEG